MIVYLASDEEILGRAVIEPFELPQLNAEANELGLFYITEEDREEAERLAEMEAKKLEGLSAFEAGMWMGWMLPVLAGLGECDECSRYGGFEA